MDTHFLCFCAHFLQTKRTPTLWPDVQGRGGGWVHRGIRRVCKQGQGGALGFLKLANLKRSWSMRSNGKQGRASALGSLKSGRKHDAQVPRRLEAPCNRDVLRGHDQGQRCPPSTPSRSGRGFSPARHGGSGSATRVQPFPERAIQIGGCSRKYRLEKSAWHPPSVLEMHFFRDDSRNRPPSARRIPAAARG
ncbi:MAG: hypothetical protein KatS3mg077_3343 [Candidatus Binatia bacterium]|nr:MAG: hypothetical protein KatS3mg077_3343 [Candidatus Binatia bacterium]